MGNIFFFLFWVVEKEEIKRSESYLSISLNSKMLFCIHLHTNKSIILTEIL